ncbi:MAG: hypothetical protein HY551_05590 [Elusimicrobia bacterium]|nr:hypothetical protein [Elusimicrobiota bacterium]
MIRKADGAVLALLWLVPLAFLAGLAVSGRTPFWGDLAYIHHPWRSLVAQMVQGGALPLWNPYAYLGMPLAAQMQSAAWYPGGLFFNLWSFERGLLAFYVLHYGLIGTFAYLWLRRERCGRAAACAGALVFMANGILVSRIPFLNHLSTLAYLPAFLLFVRSPWLLGLAFVLCFLSGYPSMLAGGSLCAFVTSWLLGRRRPSLPTWVLSGCAAAAGSAVLLFPALALAVDSQRGAGLASQEVLRFGFHPSDWRQLLSPRLVLKGEFSPWIYWWKTAYLGLAAWAFAAAGLWRLPRKIALELLGCGALLAIVVLGGSNALSSWIWEHFAPFRYIRYPGNLSYLALPAAAWLVAAGLNGKRWAVVGALWVGMELVLYAGFSHPTVQRGYFSQPGPLVRYLQATLSGHHAPLSGHRYLLSPSALEWHRGKGRGFDAAAADLKHRLYGLTNVPFHLASAGNFGEPLVPKGSYDFMDFLYSRPGAASAARYLAWADIRFLLTRDPVEVPGLNYRGETLWHVYEEPRARGRALWLAPEAGRTLDPGLDETRGLPDLREAVPVAVSGDREDRYEFDAATPAGWLYVAQPRTPGWRTWLDGRPAAGERALRAFQKFAVPQGRWTLHFRYDPASWRLGVAVTLLAILACAAYWYNRAASARL